MLKFASLAIIFLLAVTDAKADEPDFAPLLRLLDYCDAQYDDQQAMLEVVFHSPGYHSQIASGTSVHPTRESFYYAVALLKRNETGDVARAKKIIAAVLPLQETRSSSANYGVWPWVLEEPLDQMDSVDLNWADFCGSAMAQMLVDHADDLDAALIKQMKDSLRRAAIAIKRRDVQPGYTNIAILGGGVCAVAGERLGDQELLNYGRQRLEKCVAHTAAIDGFSEYNSPPYGKVVIAECERILQLATDDRVRRAAASLHRSAWKMVAESFHPETNQWAGPHSRFSTQHLTLTMVEFLNARIQTDPPFKVELHPQAYQERPRGYGIVTPRPCPAEFQQQFLQPDTGPRQLRRMFIEQRGSSPATVGTTWFSQDASLGSVSLSSFWTQRKPVIGYWKTSEDPAVVFRVRFLHDGNDFASMAIRTTQDHHRVLCAIHSLQRRGDWHRTLDRPADGIFSAKDLRVRVELTGKGVSAEKISGDRFALVAGKHAMLVCPAASEFNGRNVKWTHVNADGACAIEGVCYSGVAKKFDFSRPLEMKLGFGIELGSSSSVSKSQLPKLQPQPGKVIARWNVAPDSLATTKELTIAVPNGQR